jgi:C4-dicarboxylate-specific signal transduction histidine kinase
MSDNVPKPADSESRQIAFFGKITASVTHELNNVISIIEQTAGLLDDLIAGEERGIPIATERLATVSTSVQKQTQRGLGIIERLNKFAHSTDHAVTEFDLNETTGNLVELSRRLAGLKRIELDFRRPNGPLKITGNPFALQHAIFTGLQLVLEAATPDSTVVIENQSDERGAVVRITFDGDTARVRDRIEAPRVLMRMVDGEADVDPTEGSLLLTIPGQSLDRGGSSG